MKTIEYAARGKAFADAVAEKKAREFLLSDEGGIVVSTENFIEATRALIAEKVIDHSQVHFYFEGKILQPDKDGRCEEWPRGFCDYNMNWLSRILAAAVNKSPSTD